MDVYESIKRRYSCRSYQDRAIEGEKLGRIMDSAVAAPTAKNLRDWRFIVVTDEKIKSALMAASNNQPFVEKCAAVIVGCSNNDYVMRCGQAIGSIDISIAMEHIALTATAEGLASCWIGSFYPEKVAAALGIPEEIEIVELMTLGYAADEESHRPIGPKENYICYQKWQF